MIKLSEAGIKQSLDAFKKSHLHQIKAMSGVADFLEIIATAELKCAQILNQTEEYALD